MRKLFHPMIALACIAISLLQALSVEAYFHDWLNQDVGLGFFIAGGVGAIPMVILGGAGPGGGTSRAGWAFLIVTNTVVYYALAMLVLWARQRKPRSR